MVIANKNNPAKFFLLIDKKIILVKNTSTITHKRLIFIPPPKTVKTTWKGAMTVVSTIFTSIKMNFLHTINKNGEVHLQVLPPVKCGSTNHLCHLLPLTQILLLSRLQLIIMMLNVISVIMIMVLPSCNVVTKIIQIHICL